MRRIKRKIFNSLVVILSLAASLLLCELGCRAYLLARFRKPSAVSYAPFGYDRSPFLAFERDSWQRFITAKNSEVHPALLRPFALTVFCRKAYVKILESVNKEKTIRALAAGEYAPRQRYLMAQGENRLVLRQFYDNLSSILAILAHRKIDAFAVTLFSEKDLLAGDREVILKHPSGINQPYPDEYHLTDKGNEFLAELAAGKISAQIRRRQ